MHMKIFFEDELRLVMNYIEYLLLGLILLPARKHDTAAVTS